MKISIKHIISALAIVFVASACDNWLDVTSSDEIRAEDQFNSEAGFKDALMGIYINMTDPAAYSRDMTWNMVDVLSHQYSNLSDLADYYQVQEFHYHSTKSTPQIKAVWTRMYNCIANVNSELGYMDDNEDILNPINYSIIRGELLGLRAFLHFDLMRLFGHSNVANRSDIASKFAIPYVSDYTKDMTAQLTYEETFDLMLADIDEALELLKDDPIYNDANRPSGYYTEVNFDGFYDNRENRMNYYAVQALKARVLMWAGGQENIEEAGDLAKDIIANASVSLINSQTHNITKDPILYQEHLFSLNITSFTDIVDQYINASSAENKNALFLSTTTTASVYETDSVDIGVVDIRYNTLLEDQTLGKACVKLRQKAGNVRNENGHINMMPLIKLSEMYYIAAESDMEKAAPNIPEAIQFLNTVRASRGILQEIPADADAETIDAELIKEYRKEFVCEGQLFFFYKRKGMENIPGLSAENIIDDEEYMLPFPDGELEFGRVQ